MQARKVDRARTSISLKTLGAVPVESPISINTQFANELRWHAREQIVSNGLTVSKGFDSQL